MAKRTLALLLAVLLCCLLTVGAYADESKTHELIRADNIPEDLVKFMDEKIGPWSEAYDAANGETKTIGTTWGGGWRGISYTNGDLEEAECYDIFKSHSYVRVRGMEGGPYTGEYAS